MRHADRIERLQPSPIRDILAALDQPGMISFAGGLPATDTFPAIDQLLADELDAGLLQYGASEGEAALREWIAADFSGRARAISPDQVLILSGSQQGIDLVAKLMIDDKSSVAVESPTYLAALQVFQLFGARLRSFSPDAPQVTDADLVYVNPTFQNPTGHCYSRIERIGLAKACDQADAVLFEDDPYRALAYEDCERTPVVSMLESASWIYQSSFSKELAPGLRLGYLIAGAELMPKLTWLKQAADLHSNRLSQHLVLKMLTAPTAAQRIASLQEQYRLKRDTFASLLQTHFSGLASWSIPAGGLFFWLHLNSASKINTSKLLQQALARGVAFMPGEPFFVHPAAAANTLRLNFSHASGVQAERGLKTLASLVREAAMQQAA